MKVVKSFKGLKKWAKTTFIALLTICIITTTTGVGSLIAYADPTGDPASTGEPTPGSTDPATGTTPGSTGTETGSGSGSTDPATGTTPGSTDPETGSGSGSSGTTTDPTSGATDPATGTTPDSTPASDPSETPADPHTHSYTVTSKTPNDESTHTIVQTCSCGDTISTVESHNMSGGACTVCGYLDLSYSGTDSETSSGTDSGTDSGTASGTGSATGSVSPDYQTQTRGLTSTPMLGAYNSPGTRFSGGYTDDQPAAYSDTIIYNGSDQLSGLFNVGTAKTSVNVGVNSDGPFTHNLTADTAEFYYLGGSRNNSFTNGIQTNVAVNAGSYRMDRSAVFTKDNTYPYQGHQTSFNGSFWNYIAPRPITPDYGVTVSSVVYNAATNSATATVTYNSSSVSNLNYTISLNTIPSLIDLSTSTTASIPGAVTVTGRNNFTDSVTLDATVSAIPLKYDDRDLNTTQSYVDQVRLSSSVSEVQISLEQSGPFSDSTLYAVPTDTAQSFPVYLKTSTGLIIKQTAGPLQITETIPVRYDGAYKVDEYTDKVDITAEGYLISTSEEGPFTEKYTHTRIGEKQAFYLYFLDKSNPNGTPTKKLITDITIVKGAEAQIPIRYDGKETKKPSYTDKVTITAQGYQIGTSAEGPFSKEYVHRKVGMDQNFYLYFVDESNPSATPVKKLITDINIVAGVAEADEGAPTGYIKVDTYASDKLAKDKNAVYITQEKRLIEIGAVDESGSSVKIEYFTSDKYYETRSEIEGAVTEAADPGMDKSQIDKNAKWKTYYSDGMPTLTENTGEYIYARISDESGNTRYLSTGRIIYDTKAPTVNTIMLAEGNDGILSVLTGKDNLSGIYRFYLRYIEKDKKDKTPTALEIIGDNWYIENLTGDELAAGGSFKMPTLDPKKTYIFYGVAIDKAGNISEVKEYETKGKASADNSASKNSIDDPNAGSGLTPAPNGIAGSGTPEPKPKPTSGPEASSGAAGTPDSPASGSGSASGTAATPVPYIADATGDTQIGLNKTGGWDKIESEVAMALSGTRMSVEMSGSTVVPDSMIKTLKDKDVSVTLKMADDIEWIIRGEDVTQAKGTDIDLRVRRDTQSIPRRLLDDMAGDQLHTEIDIAHGGDFGFATTLRIPFGEKNAGKYGNLFYYDTDAGELKLLQSAVIGNDGYAEYKLDHASNYTVVVNTVNMAEALGQGEISVNTLTSNVASSTLSLLPENGRSILGMRIWLFVVAIICAIMCLAILLVPSFRHEQEYLE